MSGEKANSRQLVIAARSPETRLAMAAISGNEASDQTIEKKSRAGSLVPRIIVQPSSKR